MDTLKSEDTVGIMDEQGEVSLNCQSLPKSENKDFKTHDTAYNESPTGTQEIHHIQKNFNIKTVQFFSVPTSSGPSPPNRNIHFANQVDSQNVS